VYLLEGNYLPTKRVKMDIYDTEGNKISISFDGKINKDKIIQLIDLVEMLILKVETFQV